MLIVLDCPSCAKRYEVDAALAGKKSRCKQCGEIFRIPVPNAAVASPPTSTVAPRPERFSTDVSDRPQSVAADQPARQRRDRRRRVAVVLSCGALHDEDRDELSWLP